MHSVACVILRLTLAVLVRLRLVTDRQTHEQPTTQQHSYASHASMASRRRAVKSQAMSHNAGALMYNLRTGDIPEQWRLANVTAQQLCLKREKSLLHLTTDLLVQL